MSLMLNFEIGKLIMNKSVNIVHVSPTDIASDPRILKEISAIVDHRADVNIIGLSGDLGEGDLSKHSFVNFKIKKIKLRSYSWLRLPRPIRLGCYLIELNVRFFFKLLKCKPDIIHVHDFPALLSACIAKKITGAKLIYDAHELESNKNGTSNFESKIVFFLEKTLWKFVNSFVTVSDSIGDWYNENFGKKLTTIILNSPILTLNNGAEDNHYLREMFDISKEDIIFLYLGALGNGKYIDELIKIFAASAPNHHLVFVGYGDKKDMILEVSVKNKNIHHHAPVFHTEIRKLCASADFGLCLIENISLSDYYCLPNKFFQYIFCGLPIIASNFPDMSRLVDKYDLGYAVDLDEYVISSLLGEIKRGDHRKPLDVSNFKELSWQNQEKKLKHLYDSLLGSHILEAVDIND